MAGRGRARRYLLVKQGYYPQVVADAGYTVFDWDASNLSTLYQDSAKTTPVTANSDPVGAWVDGVSGVDAIQATTANKPTYTTASLNGLPTLSFDGGDLLATANISISTFAVWCVFRNSGTAAVIWEQSTDSVNNNGQYLYTSAVGSLNVRRGGTRINKNGALLTDNTWRVVRQEHNGTYTSLRYYGNSAEITTTTTGTPADLGETTATNALFIGARSGVSFPLIGNIAHICIVSPHPTDTSIIANMESYINSKWSVY